VTPVTALTCKGAQAARVRASHLSLACQCGKLDGDRKPSRVPAIRGGGGISPPAASLAAGSINDASCTPLLP